MRSRVKEAESFSERLRVAMAKRGYKEFGATALAEALTPVFPSGLSVQTTHNWASGKSVPRADRIALIAKLLDVSPHWLQHGPDPQGERKNPKTLDGEISGKAFAERFHALTTDQRRIMLALLHEFERGRSR
ncbi:hypothetical protein [Variovorax sp. J31P207]|uniref:hypothetical protein n=1 Tax=Variovorax sp. J31P207 TaxID=3053510 RepID=UPI002576749D|nr:hypothetical protein [Variovorax sp. J31P207]MDM0072266.1 hypothetical protein [Variovorax sp. J31P207]